MPAASADGDRIRDRLRQFLRSTGRSDVFSDSTHITRDLGLKSDEGVDFVLDLCDEFQLDFPADLNPFVHATGQRGLRVGEMIKTVLSHVPAQTTEALQ